MSQRRPLALLAGLTLAVSIVTACQPPPPRLLLTVTTTAGGADDVPGDGICASSAAGGGCTLRAAVEEGNTAADGADIAVNGGTYNGVVVEVTGDVAIKRNGLASVKITGPNAAGSSNITVAPGGRLELAGINTSRTAGSESRLRVEVDGSALIVGSWVESLDVGSGGSTVLVTSIVGGSSGDSTTTNSGVLVAVASSILDDVFDAASTPTLVTNPGGTTHLAATVVAQPSFFQSGGLFRASTASGCGGQPTLSLGYAHLEIPCGGATAIGDGTGPAQTIVDAAITFDGMNYTVTGLEHELYATSPLIDAVPVGVVGCGEGAVDFYGNPRGVDGDGDGIGGCDIGAVERQP